ncbi:alkaline phosphatase family protein, partial [Flavobacteriaceae bacterium]|nr:alkaline phosphatase family protein [Flavobacteriaceae bacterium]
DKFGNKGFNELIKNGTSFENAHFNYIPTFTAVGHTSVYTGTTPKNHGIIGNNWYDKFQKKSIYVVDDANFKTIGSLTKKIGQKSPKRLLASTIADQLKLGQNFKGKTFGVAIKDRSSILPVGHSANAAFWFDGGKEGKWITSTYYTEFLPIWAQEFNLEYKTKLDEYLAEPWLTKKELEDYTESDDDDKHYEVHFKGEEKAVFPHNIHTLKEKNGNYSILKSTPFGNTMTLDFAKSLIENEKLGDNKEYSDFLAVSLSSTDYIGHKFGAASKEIEDTYIRLNDDLADFIGFLDSKVGMRNYVLFLTADHAVSQIPHYLTENKIPGGYFSGADFLAKANEFLKATYQQDSLVENVSNQQIFLNHNKIKKLGLNTNTVATALKNEIINYEQIHTVTTAATLQEAEFTKAPLSLLQEGYNQKLSGDVLFTLNPSVISNHYSKGGTTHGSGYNYDTHVPVIFFGAGISRGTAVKKRVNITQIAPTVANILQIEQPNMCTSEILTEVFEKNVE